MVLTTIFVLALITQFLLGILYAKAPDFVNGKILKIEGNYQQMMFIVKAGQAMLLATLFLMLTDFISDAFWKWRVLARIVLLLPLLVALLGAPKGEQNC
ncbi:MAG: hypothetical protein AAFN81_25400 [Bacteroidota bacterium]